MALFMKSMTLLSWKGALLGETPRPHFPLLEIHSNKALLSVNVGGVSIHNPQSTIHNFYTLSPTQKHQRSSINFAKVNCFGDIPSF
jgi:hypothetical protein